MARCDLVLCRPFSLPKFSPALPAQWTETWDDNRSARRLAYRRARALRRMRHAVVIRHCRVDGAPKLLMVVVRHRTIEHEGLR